MNPNDSLFIIDMCITYIYCLVRQLLYNEKVSIQKRTFRGPYVCLD